MAMSDVGTHLSEAGTACHRLFSRDPRPKNWSSTSDNLRPIFLGRRSNEEESVFGGADGQEGGGSTVVS
jgi:hypothetical protein